MWWQNYQDKDYDAPAKQFRLDAGKGSNCEMNERLGWGDKFHHYRRQRSGILSLLWSLLSGKKINR